MCIFRLDIFIASFVVLLSILTVFTFFTKPVEAPHKAQALNQSDSQLAANTPLQLKRYVEPEYPQEAQLKNIQGYCELQFDVNRQGLVNNIKIVEKDCSNSAFAKASIAALEQFEYLPKIIAGQAKTTAGISHRFVFINNQVAAASSL